MFVLVICTALQEVRFSSQLVRLLVEGQTKYMRLAQDLYVDKFKNPVSSVYIVLYYILTYYIDYYDIDYNNKLTSTQPPVNCLFLMRSSQQFLRATALRAYAIAIPSVCPSICLSVCHTGDSCKKRLKLG